MARPAERAAAHGLLARVPLLLVSLATFACPIGVLANFSALH